MNMRERLRWPGCALVLGLLLASLSMPVSAEDDLDVTISVIEDNGGDIEREVTRRIELPPRARGNEARSNAPGRDVSQEARERGREFGQSRAEEARKRRGPPDNAGAGPPGNPGGGPPDNPGGGRPPDNPGGG